MQDEDGNLFIPTDGQFLIDGGDVALDNLNNDEQQLVYYANNEDDDDGEVGGADAGAFEFVQYVNENGEVQQQQQENGVFLEGDLEK